MDIRFEASFTKASGSGKIVLHPSSVSSQHIHRRYGDVTKAHATHPATLTRFGLRQGDTQCLETPNARGSICPWKAGVEQTSTHNPVNRPQDWLHHEYYPSRRTLRQACNHLVLGFTRGALLCLTHNKIMSKTNEKRDEQSHGLQ